MPKNDEAKSNSDERADNQSRAPQSGLWTIFTAAVIFTVGFIFDVGTDRKSRAIVRYQNHHTEDSPTPQTKPL